MIMFASEQLTIRKAFPVVLMAAFFFAVSELALAAAGRVLIPVETWLILFGLEFGLAFAVAAAALVVLALPSRILVRKHGEAGSAALRTAGAVLAMPLFYVFYTLNTRGLALLPRAGFERLFFNVLFVLLACATLAAATRFFMRFSGRIGSLSFWAGCFFLQFILPAVNYYFFSSRPSPVSPIPRLIFLLALTLPLFPASWLVSRAVAGLKPRGVFAIFAVGGLVLVPLLLMALVPPLSNYRRQPPSGPVLGAAGRPNIVFAVIDTGRKDRCSLYGHTRPTTPRLEELAADGIVFEDAYTVSPWTLPSHASMFTGLYPSQHGADNVETAHQFARPLSPDALTLAEILRAEGYQTAALTANHGVMNSSFGLAQGFEYYFDERPYIYNLVTVHLMAKADENLLKKLGINAFYLSSELNRRVFSWLEKNRREPFFLFLNYMDPHGVDFLPPSHDGLFGGGVRPLDIPFEAVISGREDISPEDYEALLTRYDETLTFCDANLGRLIDRLKTFGLYETSLVVVVSDHGQLLGEHNFFGHRSILFEEVLKIPLVVKPPRGSDLRVDGGKPFENRELFFLLLEELGIPIPPSPLRTLTDAEGALYTMAEAYSFPVFSAMHIKRFGGTRVSVTRHVPPRPKLVMSSKGEDRLYLLDEDPFERFNRIEDLEELADFLRNAWAGWQQDLKRGMITAGEERDLTEDLKERLRSLGYLVK
jgi:hypothetical protein